MPKYILPFTETNQGWYEIEADTIEQARAIVIAGDFTEDTEPNYNKGETYWDENELEEDTNG